MHDHRFFKGHIKMKIAAWNMTLSFVIGPLQISRTKVNAKKINFCSLLFNCLFVPMPINENFKEESIKL